MATGASYQVGYRRKREQKTNFKTRIKILKSGLPRIVVRPSSKHISVQLVKYSDDGDRVEATARSSELKKHGWSHNTGNLPSAYLTGYLCGLKCKSKNVNRAILDFGMNTSVKGSRIYAALKGALDAGIEISHDAEMLPSKERLEGAHISSHVKRSSSITSDLSKTKSSIENGFRK
jgi:large subunit ribosomal protein L18